MRLREGNGDRTQCLTAAAVSDRPAESLHDALPASKTNAPKAFGLALRHAFTLLELLIVLVILAVVSTIALNAVQPRADSRRFEETRKALEQVRVAIQGVTPPQRPAGNADPGGFVADIGRLPQTRNPGGPGQFEELISINTELAANFPFRFRAGPRSPVDYSQVQLPCGWRGPYLVPGAGMEEPRDGWGEPFGAETNGDGELIAITWDRQLEYTVPLRVGLGNSFVTVSGTINSPQSEQSDIRAVMLVPNPDGLGDELAVLDDEDDIPQTFTFRNVPIGLRAIHLTRGDQTRTVYVQVPYGGLSLVVDF